MIYTVVSYKVANTKHSIVQSLPTNIEPGGYIQQPLSIAGYSGITEIRSIIEQKRTGLGFASLRWFQSQHLSKFTMVELELEFWDLKP